MPDLQIKAKEKASAPAADGESSPKPAWLKVRLPTRPDFFQVAELLKGRGLNTICQSARCPNISECWSSRTATFLLLGDVCTRNCAFCAVTKGTPLPPNPEEPEWVAETVGALGLDYAVLTSVTRDDLADGGASHFVQTIKAIKAINPEVRVEVLIPDFKGDRRALMAVVESGPDILNHNLETTERRYPTIHRPSPLYRRSLELLRRARDRGAITKSGLMVGLGEEEAEILQAMADLLEVGCKLLTIGQYLQPSKAHAPVRKYYYPDEFDKLKAQALSLGFAIVEAGPLVRSSYQAKRMFDSFTQRQG